MNQKKNYQIELEKKIKVLNLEEHVPKLLIHSCCAPCSSYVLEYLTQYFEITIHFYNPNIFPEEEFYFRQEEQQKFIENLNAKYPIHFVEGNYESERFYQRVKGFEGEKEGGARCEQCFRLRLEETAILAQKGEFDFFTTTLTISPLKNAGMLNEIGEELGTRYQVEFLPSDFKKKGGYQRSVALSKEYNLYRQNYCGCVFSKKEQEQ